MKIYWPEGIQIAGTVGWWYRWNQTRVYTKIPAGTHSFAVQCVNNGNTSYWCGDGSVGCSFGFLELAQ